MSEEKEMIDKKLVQKTIDVPMSDEALQELGDEMSEKILRKVELEDQVASYTGHRKKEIKQILEELEPLAEKFHDKTEARSVECTEVRDFEHGKVWYEDLEGKRVEDIPEMEMDPEGFQREFAVLLDNEPGKELLDKATNAIKELLDDDPEDGEEHDEIALYSIVEHDLGISTEIAKRIVNLLRVKAVIRGRGIPSMPFVILEESEDEDVIAQAEKEQSEELTEDMILEAVTAINELERVSVSSLQRKTGWGYNRTSRIMQTLEDRKVISEGVGTELPEILMDVEAYEAALVDATGEEESGDNNE